MFYSVGVIVVVMVALVAFTGMCSFDRKSAEHVPVTKIDAPAFFSLEARAATFPVRLPDMPQDWTVNSARRADIAGSPAPVVGWVFSENDKDGYVQLVQTDLSVAEIVEKYDENVREIARTYELDGETVQVAAASDKKVRELRIIDLADVRLVVTGAATEAQFNEVLRQTMRAQPLDTAM
ncbi:DUF4245 domain-containing protein [Corynebacterium sp. sy017]|nr:DUF4245 domain-containing protein [Corynebacterium sp. sy017]QDZ43505.1 DUF4245 domain-containing protein [Corynebacterium sp. sy039]TSD91518.1 DUF4245 domain-containing protein [Corynebacterium sp. SY003]